MQDIAKAYSEALAFKEFLNAFKNLYQSISASRRIEPDQEKAFLETKSLLERRFDDLEETVGSEAISRELRLAIVEIMAMDSLASLSDERLRQLQGRWDQVEEGFSRLLERLKRRANYSEYAPGERIKTGAFRVTLGLVGAGVLIGGLVGLVVWVVYRQG